MTGKHAAPATGNSDDVPRSGSVPASGTDANVADAQRIEVRIVRGRPTEAEVAAVTAVLSAALSEEASEQDAVAAKGPSGWQLSQRPMRQPVVPGPGQWSRRA